jgi:hypothetical protein
MQDANNGVSGLTQHHDTIDELDSEDMAELTRCGCTTITD